MLKNILGFVFVLTVATMWIYLLYSLASPDPRLVFPKTIPEIQALSSLLLEYKHDSLVYTLVFFSSAYLYKQAFAIPGSVFLNLLSGALFGPILGFLLVCILSAVGASFCFLISKYVTHGIIMKFFPRKIHQFEKLVQRNASNLFYFLLSLRLFPMTPNWLLNMSCPHVGVPLPYFFFSVLLGLSPFNFLSTQAGEMLKEIDSVDDIISAKVGIGMSLLALAVLGPTFLKRRSGDKSI